MSRNLDKNAFYTIKSRIKQGLPVNKKALLVGVLLSALLFAGVAGIQFINLGMANPYKWLGPVSPDALTKPPAITIFYPENNTVYSSNDLTISFNVSILPSPTASRQKISTVNCTTSWQKDSLIVYKWSHHQLMDPYDNDPELTEFSHKLNLTGIPEGNHNITIHAAASGIYWNSNTGWGPFGYNGFGINGSSSISFTIDVTPPKISVSSIQNKTYDITDIDLNFTVSEPVSQITYSLDGKKNATIAGNITLTKLPYGERNITLYATDHAGNIGASETIYFTVAKPFPTTIVIAPIASAAFVGAGLLVYFKKNER